MILLDTNILVYATGRDHPLREPCVRLVDSVTDGRVTATTTVQVIQEFMHVRGRAGRSQAAELAKEFAAMLTPLLTVGADDLRTGVRLFERHPSLDAFDCVLAAAAIAHEAEALVSADGAFADIRGLHHVAPGTAAFEDLLRG